MEYKTLAQYDAAMAAYNAAIKAIDASIADLPDDKAIWTDGQAEIAYRATKARMDIQGYQWQATCAESPLDTMFDGLDLG